MKHQILCEQCLRLFDVWPYEFRQGRRFCSAGCHDASRRNTKEGFYRLIERPLGTECWIWCGRRTPDDYGIYYFEGEQLAHRVSYRLAHGSIPDGRCLDHLCRTHSCVNPAHLEPTTWRENILRGQGLAAQEAAATHCRWGHPFDAENTLRRKDGGRFCRACGRRRSREAAARKRETAQLSTKLNT